MSSLLSRRFSSSQHHHHLALLAPLLRLSLSTKSQPQKELPFLADYLITSFGFSLARALKVSTEKRFGPIKSSDRPDAVVRCLKDVGFSDEQIKSAILRSPILLSYNVDKCLIPKMRELMAIGFSVEVLAQLLQCSPSAFARRHTLSRLLFWREFLGADDDDFVKFIRRNPFLFNFDIDKKIVPKINLLKECGLSNGEIALILGSGSSCMRTSLDHLRQVIDMIEDMGIPRTSGMFFAAFRATGNYSIDTIRRKREFLQTTYGWSEQQTCVAYRKFPYILNYSEEKVKSSMDFLIKEVKLHPSSIPSMPQLLGYSLEKRLIPRHQVLTILSAKKIKERCHMLTACLCSEKTFLEKYIEPYKKVAPELSDVYFASIGCKVPASHFG